MMRLLIVILIFCCCWSANAQFTTNEKLGEFSFRSVHMYPVKIKGEYTFINSAGISIANAPTYDYASQLMLGKFVIVADEGKFGVIDTAFQETLPLQFDTIYSVSERHFLSIANGTYSLYDLEMEKVYTARLDTLTKYDDGYKVSRNGQFGFVSRLAETKIDMRYQGIRLLPSGDFLATRSGYLDLYNKEYRKVLSGCKEVGLLNDSIIKYRIHSGWKYLKPNGGKIELANDKIYMSEYGFFKVYYDSVATLYNYQNNRAIARKKYEDYFPQTEQTIAVRKEGAIGLINRSGKELIAPAYDEIRHFRADLYIAGKDFKYGLINQKGDTILPIIYSHIAEIPAKDGRLLTRGMGRAVNDLERFDYNKYYYIHNGTLEGVADTTGKVIVPPYYKGVMPYYRGSFLTYSADKFGFYSPDGKELLKCVYEEFRHVGSGAVRMRKGEQWAICSSYDFLSDQCDKAAVLADVIKVYRGNDIGIYELDSLGYLEDQYVYKNITSYKVSEYKKENKNRRNFRFTHKGNPPCMAHFSQLESKWGAKNKFQPGYKVKPKFDHIIQSKYGKGSYVTFVDSDTVFYELDGARFYSTQRLGTMSSDGGHASSSNFMYIGYKNKGKGSGMSSNTDMAIDTAGVMRFVSEKHNKKFKLNYADELHHDYIKRVYTDGELSIEKEGGDHERSLANYFDQINAYHNFHIADQNTLDLVMNDDAVGLKLTGGAWRYIEMDRSDVIPKYVGLRTFQSAENFAKGTAITSGDNENVGVLNYKAESVLGPSFKGVKRIGQKYTLFYQVKQDQPFYGFVNAQGEEVFGKSVGDASEFSENKVRIFKDGNAGCISPDGKEQIPFEYDEVGDFHNGYAIAVKDGMTGAIDKNGNTVVDFAYNSISDFNDNCAIINSKTGYGIVNAEGRTVLTSDYASISDFENGFAKVTNDEKTYMVNTSGKFVFQTQKDVTVFGKGIIKTEDGEGVGLYDLKKGRSIKTGTASIIEQMNSNRILVRKNGKIGYLKSNGKWAVKPKYKRATSYKNGYANVYNDNGWTLIDTLGKKLISGVEEEFENIGGILKITDTTGTVKFINEQAQEIPAFLDLKFEGQFENGILVAQNQSGKYVYVNMQGEALFGKEFDEVKPFLNGNAPVRVDGKWGIIDQNGAYIIAPKYYRLGHFKDGLARYQLIPRTGVYSMNSKQIVNPIYENAYSVTNNVFCVEEKGKIGYLLSNGKWLWKLNDPQEDVSLK
jgi:hypothetical protein